MAYHQYQPYKTLTQLRHPKQDILQNPNALPHPSDMPVCGQHHLSMTTAHLNCALCLISAHLGLVPAVTSRTFCTLFAFKSLPKGDTPGWQIAQRMGHFDGNEDLSRLVYAPTKGVVAYCDNSNGHQLEA